MVHEIKRDYYLEQLINRKDNGLIKIVTGIKRCGKSYLLRTLFKNYLLENGVDANHIIEMDFDLFDNIDYRNPKRFYPWAKEQIKDEEQYYFLLDEVQMLDEFVDVLNGLADKKNCDVYVTGSQSLCPYMMEIAMMDGMSILPMVVYLLWFWPKQKSRK